MCEDTPETLCEVYSGHCILASRLNVQCQGHYCHLVTSDGTHRCGTELRAAGLAAESAEQPTF